jgi:uncharacterized membrane protein YeiB
LAPGSIRYDRMSMLAFGILIAQWLPSRSWPGRFRHGPLEWAWRCASWWRCVPFVRERGTSPAT